MDFVLRRAFALLTVVALTFSVPPVSFAQDADTAGTTATTDTTDDVTATDDTTTTDADGTDDSTTGDDTSVDTPTTTSGDVAGCDRLPPGQKRDRCRAKGHVGRTMKRGMRFGRETLMRHVDTKAHDDMKRCSELPEDEQDACKARLQEGKGKKKHMMKKKMKAKLKKTRHLRRAFHQLPKDERQELRHWIRCELKIGIADCKEQSADTEGEEHLKTFRDCIRAMRSDIRSALKERLAGENEDENAGDGV